RWSSARPLAYSLRLRHIAKEGKRGRRKTRHRALGRRGSQSNRLPDCARVPRERDPECRALARHCPAATRRRARRRADARTGLPPMNDVLSKAATAAEIARAVAGGKVKASAVVEAALKRIEAAEPTINAFTDLVAERARKRAAEIDAGRHRGPLMGVPFAVKNLFDIEGLPTRAGSKINIDGPKAPRDGALVRKLEDAGAILVGGLNMGEYAYDFTGENAHYGPSRNPHDTMRMTGGSSGGSGAAVAAGEVPLALGSDTNGSIRVPSSLCGLFGLKPTYGRLSRAGSFPFVDALDHVGP